MLGVPNPTPDKPRKPKRSEAHKGPEEGYPENGQEAVHFAALRGFAAFFLNAFCAGLLASRRITSSNGTASSSYSRRSGGFGLRLFTS